MPQKIPIRKKSRNFGKNVIFQCPKIKGVLWPVLLIKLISD